VTFLSIVIYRNCADCLPQRACLDKLREETADHPDWQDFDEQSADGASTRPMSSVSTPQPPQKSGFKLKLNNGSKANGSSSRQGTDSLAQSDEDE